MRLRDGTGRTEKAIKNIGGRERNDRCRLADFILLKGKYLALQSQAPVSSRRMHEHAVLLGSGAGRKESRRWQLRRIVPHHVVGGWGETYALGTHVSEHHLHSSGCL